jgi:hypothetical protein
MHLLTSCCALCILNACTNCNFQSVDGVACKTLKQATELLAGEEGTPVHLRFVRYDFFGAATTLNVLVKRSSHNRRTSLPGSPQQMSPQVKKALASAFDDQVGTADNSHTPGGSKEYGAESKRLVEEELQRVNEECFVLRLRCEALRDDNDKQRALVEDRDRAISELHHKLSGNDSMRQMAQARSNGILEKRLGEEWEKEKASMEKDRIAQVAALADLNASLKHEIETMRHFADQSKEDQGKAVDLYETQQQEINRLKYAMAEKIKAIEERDRAVQKCQELHNEIQELRNMAAREKTKLIEERDRAVEMLEEARSERAAEDATVEQRVKVIEEKNHLFKTCEDLTREMGMSRQNLGIAWQQRDEACAERDRLAEEKKHWTEVCDRQREQLEKWAKLSGTPDAVKQRVSQIEEERNRAMDAAKKAADRYEELRRDYEIHKNMLEEMRQERDSTVETCKGLEAERRAELERRHKAERDGATAVREREDALVQAAARQRELETVKHERDTSREHLHAAQDEIMALNQQLQDAQKSSADVCKSLHTLQLSHDEVIKSLQDSISDRADLRSRNGSLLSEKQALDLRVEMMDAELRTMRLKRADEIARTQADASRASHSLAGTMMSAWNSVAAISVQLKDEIAILYEKEAKDVHMRRDDVMRARAQVWSYVCA